MNKEVYKYIFRTYGRDPRMWVGFFGVLIEAFIVRVYVVIIVAQIASNIAAGNIAAAKSHTLQYLIAYCIGVVFGIVGELLATKSEDDVYEDLSVDFHRKIIGKDMAFYRDNQTGYLAGIYRQHLDGAMEVVRFWRGEAMGAVLSLIVPAIVLLFVAPKIGLVAAAVVVLQVVYIMWSSARVNDYRLHAHEIYRKISGEVSDEITNIVAFKSGGVEKQAQTIMKDLAHEEALSFWKRRKTSLLLDFPRGIVTSVGIALAIYFVVQGANKHDPSSLGLIVLTLTYMFQIIRNVAVLPNLVVLHDNIITKLHPTLKYLSADYEKIRDPDQPVPLSVTEAAIDINHIDFSYPSHSRGSRHISVFKDLDIHIAGGEQLGIVGLSGAGKSTLANLLLRFDDITSGSITIDGIDIRCVSQSELRQKIAYVPQEPLLFHRTVRENIAYYNDDASEEDIVRAAKAAHAHVFIEKLPEGYETMVGERGVKLSGGQKQRIAIARAVLKKAPIMLFDEATSALDSESEQIIQRALPEILGKQTAIIVAHRLSTVAGLDRIIVMHEGEIVEEGTHVELLKQRGRYYSLWQKQTNTSEAALAPTKSAVRA